MPPDSAAQNANGPFGRLVVALFLFIIAQFAAFGAIKQYTSEVTTSLSDRYSQEKLYSKAKSFAKLAILQNPRNGYAYFYLGSPDLVQEQYVEAASSFERGLAVMPHLPNLLKVLCQCYYFSGDYGKSVQTLTRYLRMDPLPKVTPELVFRVWAQSLYRFGDIGRAAIEFAVAESYDSYRPELLQARIGDALMLNQNTMADYYYRRFRQAFPDQQMDPNALFSNALAFGKMTSTLRFLEINRMRGDASAAAHKILAMGYAKVNRLDEAITVLKEASRMAPNDGELPLFLGDIHFQRGQLEEAARFYGNHLELAPDSRFRKEIEAKLKGRLSDQPAKPNPSDAEGTAPQVP
jgi:tetratricopeptide (TPR) repeat protein